MSNRLIKKTFRGRPLGSQKRRRVLWSRPRAELSTHYLLQRAKPLVPPVPLGSTHLARRVLSPGRRSARRAPKPRPRARARSPSQLCLSSSVSSGRKNRPSAPRLSTPNALLSTPPATTTQPATAAPEVQISRRPLAYPDRLWFSYFIWS